MSTQGGYARQVDALLKEGLEGQWYAAGGGPQSVPNGSTSRFMIRNPVGSGRNVIVHRYRIHVTTQDEYVSIRINPTGNLPTNQVAASNRFIGMPDGVSEVFLETGTAMTGGTLVEYQIPVQTGEFTFSEFLIMPGFILPPGVTLATNMTNNSGGATQVTQLLDIKEVPA